jgi:hypothetical protein
MVKKRKVLSQEEKQANFEKWKKSKEYLLLDIIKEKYSDMEELLEITPDLIGKWQEIFNELAKIQKTFKIKGKKTKLTAINQDHVRTAFFGGVNKRDEPFKIENLNLDFENKEVPKNSRHLKNNLIEILKYCNTIDTLDENNYLDFKKNKIMYKFKEFAKFFKDHIKKKGYLESKKLLDIVLNPLKELMEANFKLNVFEVNNQSEKLMNQNYFQYRALIKNFCEKYQPCQQLIFDFSNNKLKHNPDIYSILKKLNYENWELKKAEKFYIYPLLEAFNRLKANLLKLYTLGKNHWKQPTAENIKFLEDMENLINVDHIAERLVGNCLKRAQINFFYDVCKIIYNSPAKNDLVKKNKKICEKTIPKLLILQSMKHFNEIFENKVASIKKRENNYMETKSENNKKLNYELLSMKEPKKIIKPADLIPPGFSYEEEIRTIDAIRLLRIDDNHIDDLKNLGRLFLWPDLLPSESHDTFAKLSRKLKSINISLIKDLQDYIIVQGMLAVGEDYISDRENAKIKMSFLKNKAKEEIDLKIPQLKPPFIWNTPHSIKNEHNLSFSIDIFSKDYQDKDLIEIYYQIEKYADTICCYKKEEWNFLLESVLKIFEEYEDN